MSPFYLLLEEIYINTQCAFSFEIRVLLCHLEWDLKSALLKKLKNFTWLHFTFQTKCSSLTWLAIIYFAIYLTASSKNINNVVGCCVFWPVNGCSACCSLVKIFFLTLKQLFPSIFIIKCFKKCKKYQKNLLFFFFLVSDGKIR